MKSRLPKYLYRFWPLFALAIVVLPILGVLTCVPIVDEMREPDTLEFEQSTWLSEPVSSDVRYRMAKDLVHSETLLGKSQEEVFELLGPSSPYPDGRLQYGLGGPTSVFGGFQNILAIEFEDGIANKAFIYDH